MEFFVLSLRPRTFNCQLDKVKSLCSLPVSPAHAPAPAPSSLPTTIPTYDDSSLSPVKTPLPQPKATPTPPKATLEKEAAMVAAQAVASKLQEMQVAKEEERRRRKEQKMAERLAAQLTEQVPPVEEQEAAEVSRGGGRILDMVERQEGRAREGGQEERREAKQRRKRKEKDSPLLITLKPFYRPNEKNGKKKKVVRELTEAEEAALEESFVPRSPVPLPDSSGLKPSLVKPYLGVKVSPSTLLILDRTPLQMPGYANSAEKKAKGVRYADGVLPGQGSPDHGQARNTPPPPLPLPPRKRSGTDSGK